MNRKELVKRLKYMIKSVAPNRKELVKRLKYMIKSVAPNSQNYSLWF